MGADSDQTDERVASRYVTLAAAPAEEQSGQSPQLVLSSVPYATLSTLGLRVVRVQYTVPDIHMAHNIPDLMMTLGDGEQVGCEFLTYYEETGGLTRWGYAISEVLEERPGTLTQYYQRGAVDCHPKIGETWKNRAAAGVGLHRRGTEGLTRPGCGAGAVERAAGQCVVDVGTPSIELRD